MVKVHMISGEEIIGKLELENDSYVYVGTSLEWDEVAISIFGKEYAEANPTQIVRLPRDEIRYIEEL